MLARSKVQGLHHFAYRCRDAEETRAFYEDVLGMKLGIFLRLPHYEEPGDRPPFCHLFFEMDDGSYIAFFDLGDDGVSAYDSQTPEWVNHLALQVDSLETLAAYKARLEAAGVAVKGPKDHHFVQSIYFYDPNGIRLELTAWVEGEDFVKAEAAEAHDRLKAWTQEKAAAKAAE
jgi:catechol 2,3-dioxygenase-like lactoylglutathione lyase family enzyme